MATALSLIVGILAAVAIDWAIYTHLIAYLRVGLALEKRYDFGELLISGWQKARIVLIVFSGALAGLAFANRKPEYWIVASVIFVIGHSMTYLSIINRK